MDLRILGFLIDWSPFPKEELEFNNLPIYNTNESQSKD